MIAHVASSGEDRGRVVLQLGSRTPNEVALNAAIRIARAFQSEIESLFVEDQQLGIAQNPQVLHPATLIGTTSQLGTVSKFPADARTELADLLKEVRKLNERIEALDRTLKGAEKKEPQKK